MYVKIKIFVLAILYYISHVESLKCYQCDSSIDDYCPETWTRYDLEPTECDHVDYPRFCVKTTGIYGGIVGTRRFCSSRHMDNSCNELQYPQDKRIYYSCLYTCSTDGCNTANSNLVSIRFVAAVLAISKFIF